MRQIVTQPWFAFTDLLLVMVSGAVWMLFPKFGIWFTLLAFVSWGLRLLAGKAPFKRTPFDWLLVVFLITAWVGYWAAYDKTSAWVKVWLIVTSVLLYYALSAQPKHNLSLLSILSFCIGFGISIYFFLTHDFSGSPGKIALWWMSNRPQTGWLAIHHGYISGLLVITSLFAFYWLWSIARKPLGRYLIILKIILVLGLGLIVGAFILTMSRGVWAAAVCGLGVWMLWRLITSSRFAPKPGIRSLFPVLVLVYLSLITVFVYLGPASAGGTPAQSNYGINTRAEVFERGAYFLMDHPITGGGLTSFPGLYSQYILVIPFYYFANSYNLFLDVAIEQGLIGGLAIIFIYLGSIWFVARAIVENRSDQTRFFNWLALFALIVSVIHGLFYDYLYNSSGTMLLFYPVGISMIGVINLHNSKDKIIKPAKVFPVLWKSKTLLIALSLFAIIAILALNVNKLVSIWYSNLGAIQMSQVELRHFPANKWATAEIAPELETADSSLRSALRFDPDNRTANHRLGLIAMAWGDFEAAAGYLETALEQAPEHRGIIKSLGYCYTWLDNVEKAQPLLEEIPEARSELEVYVWWWDTQGRQDLSAHASEMASELKINQP